MAHTLARYDDPNFRILRQQQVPGYLQWASSVTDYAHFRCRNKCIVHAVHFRITSAASGAAGSICAVRTRNATSQTSVQTINSFSLISATTNNTIGTITLASLNTLNSISDHIACQLKTNAKGKWEITYEYQLLPPNASIIP